MEPSKNFKSRDAFGSLKVTDETFSAAFFKNNKYRFADVTMIDAVERDASFVERFAAPAIGLLIILIAIVIWSLNREGVICWGVVLLLGLLFVLLGFQSKKMIDISIYMQNGEVKKESLPVSHSSKEFLEAVRKGLNKH